MPPGPHGGEPGCGRGRGRALSTDSPRHKRVRGTGVCRSPCPFTCGTNCGLDSTRQPMGAAGGAFRRPGYRGETVWLGASRLSRRRRRCSIARFCALNAAISAPFPASISLIASTSSGNPVALNSASDPAGATRQHRLRYSAGQPAAGRPEEQAWNVARILDRLSCRGARLTGPGRKRPEGGARRHGYQHARRSRRRIPRPGRPGRGSSPPGRPRPGGRSRRRVART